MAREIDRFIKIERSRSGRWSVVPLGARVRVWETVQAEAEDGSPRVMFHIAFMEGLARGQRVSYLGQHFSLLEVSDSKRLVGLELRCAEFAKPGPDVA